MTDQTPDRRAAPVAEDGGEDAGSLALVSDHGCLTGDCPNDGHDCYAAIRDHIDSMVREAAARLRGSTEDAPEASDGVTAQELRAALRWTWKTLDGRFGRDHACPECCPEGGDLVDENFRCVRHSINRLLNGRLATEDAPERFTLAEMGDLLEAEADHIQIVGGSAKWMRDAANWFWHEAEKEIPGIVSRAATEDEGRTVGALRQRVVYPNGDVGGWHYYEDERIWPRLRIEHGEVANQMGAVFETQEVVIRAPAPTPEPTED